MKLRFKTFITTTCLVLTACSEPIDDNKKGFQEATPLNGQVNIFRGEWGVPHIYANREEDGFYGLGYSLAEDQLERIMVFTLSARGELAANVTPDDLSPHLAEAFANHNQMIESDYNVKLWRLPELSMKAVQNLDPQLKLNYQAFVNGILAFMASNPSKTPTWAIRDLNVADMIAYGQFILWGSYQAGIGMNDCRRSGVSFNTAKGSEVIPEEGWSNEWAIMPQRTSTGGAILLTDPHGGIDGRFTYEFRLHAGEFEATGYTMGPMMIVGRNANVGWAATTGSPDVADCYIVETLGSENLTYQFDDTVKEVEVRDIEIKVKGSPSLNIKAKYTDHNGVISPVVAEEEGKIYVVSTPYINELEGFHNSVYWMNKSKNVDEFRVAQYGNFPQNFMAADTNGDIMYVHAGLTPIRPDASLDWTMPQNGNSSAFEWLGLHKMDDLLTIKSPPSGYLTNNNVDTRFMDKTPHDETKDKPEYILRAGVISPEATNSRGFRAVEVLSQNSAMSEAEALSLAFDIKSVGAERWISLLKGASQKNDPSEGDYKAFLTDLLSFNGDLDQTSTAALKYVYWRDALREHLTEKNLPNLIDMVKGEGAVTDEFAEVFLIAVEEASQNLSQQSDGLTRVYGDEYRTRGLGDRSWPLSGGFISPSFGSPALNECSGGYQFCPVTLYASYHSGPNEKNEKFAMGGSRIMRIDFYSPDGIRSYSAQNPGISDDVSSPHFDDQTEMLFSKRQMKPVYFNWEDLEPNIVSSVTLDVKTTEKGGY